MAFFKKNFGKSNNNRDEYYEEVDDRYEDYDDDYEDFDDDDYYVRTISPRIPILRNRV